MIWGLIILLFLAIAISPVIFFVGLALVFIVVCFEWVDPKDKDKNKKEKYIDVRYTPYDPVKPWNEEYLPQENEFVSSFKEEHPWECEVESDNTEWDPSDDIWAEYDNNVKNTKDLALRLNGKVTVEPDFWNQWGLDFRCHLIAYGTDLRLNFEILDCENLIPWEEEPGFWIQTNFYDKDNKLLYGSECDIDMDALKQHRVTDYYLFDSSFLLEADHVLVYGYRGY